MLTFLCAVQTNKAWERAGCLQRFALNLSHCFGSTSKCVSWSLEIGFHAISSAAAPGQLEATAGMRCWVIVPVRRRGQASFPTDTSRSAHVRGSGRHGDVSGVRSWRAVVSVTCGVRGGEPVAAQPAALPVGGCSSVLAQRREEPPRELCPGPVLPRLWEP